VSDAELAWAPARVLADRVRAGDVTARAVCEAHLERIHAVEPRLGALLHVADDAARAAADAVDARVRAGEDPGPLAGVPVGVKDNLCTEGVDTTAGSRILAGFRPPYDAAVVERLRAAGAVVIGKTNLDEFAMGSSTENSAFGPTRNPWDLERVPGGSSGGSAACVAAGEAPLAVGSDTGGSIRQPAALCGVVGLKPTYGLVSRYGLIAFASSLDQVGPLARDAADAALLMDALFGPDPRDMTSRDPADPTRGAGPLAADYAGPGPFSTAAARGSLEGVTLGVLREHLELTADADVRARVEGAVARAEAAGAAVRDVRLELTRFAIPAYQVCATAEASSNLARYDGVRYGHRHPEPVDLTELVERSRAEGFGPEVRRRILLGTFVLSSGFYDAYYLKALRARRRIRADFERALAGVDALIGPTSPVPAFPLGERVSDPLAMYAVDAFTVATNLAGLPAVSVPAGATPAGLPVGVQLTGPAFADARLLGLAAALEAALALPARRPEALTA